MPTELAIPLVALWQFLLVVARVGSAISFVPVPGLRHGLTPARAWLAILLALVLRPAWPVPRALPDGPLEIGALLLVEVAIGVMVGAAVALLNESFVLASQIFGLQAGYGYAATIDPATQADSSVLQILTHLTAGLLFFAAGLDQLLIRAFAHSLQALPSGTFPYTGTTVEVISKLGSVMFSTAVRMALPVVALLLLVDLALALLGRIHAQLQLLTLAFPAKMLVSMLVLAATAVLLPVLYRSAATPVMEAIQGLLGLRG